MAIDLLTNEWIRLGLFLVICFIGSKAIHYTVILLAKHLVSKTETDEDDILLQRINIPLYILILVWIFSIFSENFFFIRNQVTLDKLFYTILLILGARIVISVLNLIANIWGIQFAKKSQQ